MSADARKLASIQALRGVAVLGVVAFHAMSIEKNIQEAIYCFLIYLSLVGWALTCSL